MSAIVSTTGSSVAVLGGVGNAAVFGPLSYVYCVGGQQGSTYSNVYYSSLSATGVGAWTSANSYPIPIRVSSCTDYGGYVYCIDGINGGGADVNNVYYAALSSGGVGTWAFASNYPLTEHYHTCAASGGYVYCVGGYTGSVVNNVYYAAVSGSGTGAWSPTTNYPIPIYDANCAIYGNVIYCIGGGSSGFAPLTYTYYAPISSGGVGAWSLTTPYPANVQDTSCATNAGYIYCVGGSTNGNTNVYYAAVSGSGIASWTATNSYPVAITSHSCGISGGEIYCIGGAISGSSPTGAVYYAAVSSAGVGAWTASNSYPIALRDLRCVIQ
ncbi:MAG: hypothetical protein KGH71_05255 [Candidatus Micrarchaeota archaeon]|nr:hypothetical protein [Candidatus Micrarchaeota archaeon]